MESTTSHEARSPRPKHRPEGAIPNANISPEARVISKTEEIVRPRYESARDFVEPKIAATKEYVSSKGLTWKRAMVWAGLVVVVVTLFQNLESTSIDFLFWSFTAPKIITFAIMIAVGAIVGLWVKRKFDESRRAKFN